MHVLTVYFHARFLLIKNNGKDDRNKHFISQKKRRYRPHFFLSDKGLKGPIVIGYIVIFTWRVIFFINRLLINIYLYDI